MVREGKSGHQKVIGYAATKEEALQLLAEYNGQPWNLDAASMTFNALWEMWKNNRAPALMQQITLDRLIGAYHHTEPLWALKYKRIHPYQMQAVIDGCGCGYGTQRILRTMFRQVIR